ncbi:MAG: DMT family transporter [Pseudomonadota bacterium]
MGPTVTAALWMLGTISSFSLMAVAGRELASDLDTFEIMLYRSVVGVIIVVGVGAMTRSLHQVQATRLGTHLIRNIAHFTGQNLWFYSVALIPLAQVFALEFTTPIWVILLSPLILGERITAIRALAAALGFVGILIVARPDFNALSVGLITAAACAIFFAISITFTKRLTRHEEIVSILFWLTAMQLVMGLVMAGYDGDVALPDAATAPWLVLVGIAGLCAHYCLTKALSIAPATVVVPIDFARLPTIAVVGMVLYAEALDVWVFVGAAVIFAGNYINLWHEARRTAAT